MPPVPTARQPVRKYSWLAHLPISRKILLGIALLLALFVIASSITLYTQAQQETSRHWAEHSYRVQLAIAQAERTAQYSQLGLRGYMLAHADSEREQFTEGMRQLRGELPELRRLTNDNPLQQSRLDRIESLLGTWEKEATQLAIAPLRRLKGSDADTAARQDNIVNNDYLQHRSVSMQDILDAFGQMSATESTLLDQRSAHLHRMLLVNHILAGLFALLSVALGLMVISLTSRLVTRPLRRITTQMSRLAAHDYDIEIRSVDRRDEIGQIARALHVFKQMAIETDEKTWLKGRTAEVSRHLQEATSHRDFGQRLTAELSRLLQLGIGLFYGYDADRQRLDLLGSYGMRMDIQAGVRYVPGEGLVGQCALDRQPIRLDQVPDDYLRIDSGSGAALPHHVTLLPVLLRDQLVGVLELASFQPLSELQQQLLDALLPVVALTLENLNRAVATQELLEQTREQADDLRVSGITLRQQQEALTESNASLQRKTAELEEQSQRLLASEEELRVQADELHASNEELRLKTDTLREQKQTLEALQRDTEEKAAELARASQYKSEFLANMSHELRTPLNSLLILSRSLADNREGNLDDEQVESARIIHDAGTSLLRLINDILDLSKIEAGKMELSTTDYPLSQLAQSLRRNFDHVARDKQVTYEVTLEPGLPAQIQTDPGKLEQVANNLLSNAFKFTAQGSVRVVIGRPAADLPVPEALAGQALLAISVKDSGIGIPADKLQRIFNAFEQVDASTSRHYGGTGLGLSISRRMAALLGGDVLLQSTLGEGSTFTLLLPEHAPEQARPAAPEAREAPVRRPAVPAMPAQNIGDDREHIAPGDSVILVVEDDLSYARILADMARQKGHRALHAADGESALELARRFRPLGILLDVMLPGMDGWTVIERLKAEPATRHIPVHFLSAVDESERSRELGAVGFLTKPVSREAIDGAFERLLHFAEGRPRHLLVVDDDADARSAVRSLLRQDDVSIDEAGSAEEALQKIAEASYDCIVLDLGLPGMSGLDLLQQLAREGSVPPVVVYSGRELSREENLALRQYTDSIVIKGARSPERLLDEVSLFLHSINRNPAGASEAASGEDLKGRRVLVVDDDMRNLFALAKVLRDWGIQVSMAQDGPKALAQLREDEGLELVLMDIMMPGMDGYETIRAIRDQPRLANLPVIALTAKAMRGDREKCLEAGANDYLSKPIDVDKLGSMIRVWLRR